MFKRVKKKSNEDFKTTLEAFQPWSIMVLHQFWWPLQCNWSVFTDLGDLHVGLFASLISLRLSTGQWVPAMDIINYLRFSILYCLRFNILDSSVWEDQMFQKQSLQNHKKRFARIVWHGEAEGIWFLRFIKLYSFQPAFFWHYLWGTPADRFQFLE